ncbi:DsbA family protein [Candidatus Saccharibacteria bacterium]|nr:DsbA family protein [Candidatus Saccharibacteria bacterium]
MNKTAWIVFSLVIVAILGGAVYLSSQNKLDISNITKEQMANIIGPEERNGQIGDRTVGNEKSKIVLIEYGDYQCPGCRTAAPEARRVAEKYKDHIVLVFRNFPISSSHPNARAAAAAAEAAGQQGKYWQMHDLLYENQDSWAQADLKNRTKVFTDYARDLGLDETKFSETMASPEVSQKINFDYAIGRAMGVSATPTFYLNGEALEAKAGNYIEEAVQKELTKAGIEIPADETE